MSWAELSRIAPVLWLVAGGVVVLLVEAFTPRRDSDHLSILSAVFLVLAGVSANMGLGHPSQSLFHGVLRADAFGAFFDILFVIIALLTVSFGAVYLRRQSAPMPEFYVLVLFATAGMMLLASSTDLVGVFLSLELMSIGVYVLAAIQRNSSYSQEAGFKYLILGAFASAFLLYGIALIYGTTGTTQFEVLSARMGGNPALAKNLVFWGGWGLILVGLGFKVAMVPFHQWTPDVYAGAPAPVAGYMAAGVKAAAFAVLVRLIWTGMPLIMGKMAPLLMGFAVLTMVFGNIVALAQSNLKRMLAYSAIAHAGYLLVGVLAISGQNDDPATRGILFYLASYALMNLGAFGAVTFVSRRRGERSELSGFAGLARRHPWVSFFLAVCMFSLAGVPPTAGFWGKFYVFSAVIQRGMVALAVVALLNSAVAAYYYLRVVVYLYMREPGEDAYIGDDVQASAAIGVAAILLLWIGLFPSSVLELARLGAAALARTF